MPLETTLDRIEARVFGVLVEKALTTPDQYPLTLNAATNGCNQKSNRDPVLTLDEMDVDAALRRLEQKYLARRVFPGNSRVEKFVHNGKDALGLDAPGLAILAELLMRGPQTPGDLRARAGRMIAIESLEQLTTILGRLIERGYVQRLPPAPGSRAERYAQLVSPDSHPTEVAAPMADAEPALRESVAAELTVRLTALEDELQALRDRLFALEQRLAARSGGQ
jgi:uncharacterized protein YceH (UPF0502 family)